MSNVIELKKRERDNDPYFGLCPECGYSDGYFNYGRAHYFKCDEHRTVWYVGANLFSSWHDETKEDWDRNAKRYGSYCEVEPIHSMKLSPGEYRCGQYFIHVANDGIPRWELRKTGGEVLMGDASAFPGGEILLCVPDRTECAERGWSQAEIDARLDKLPALDMELNDYAVNWREPIGGEFDASIPF